MLKGDQILRIRAIDSIIELELETKYKRGTYTFTYYINIGLEGKSLLMEVESGVIYMQKKTENCEL